MTAIPTHSSPGDARTLAPEALDGQAHWPTPRPGFAIFLGLSIASVYGALLAAAVLTLSLKATQIDPDNATTVLSIVVGVGSFFSILGYPVLGRLSDRSLSRFGRRRPYLVAGAIVLAGGGLLVVASTSTLVLTVAWIITTLGSVSAIVATSALVPDQVEPSRRGLSSAMIGLGTPVGAVLGLFLAQLVQPNLAAMILLPIGFAVGGVLLLALVVREQPLARSEREPFSVRDLVGTFWVNPFTNTSFGWAWWSRFLLFFGVAAVNSYQAFYLIVVLHQNPATVGTQIFLASLVLTGISLVLAPLAGKLSDKIGRRKPFVIVSAIIFGIGLALVAAADSFPGFLLAIAVMGIGQGVYFAVDFALVTELLPDKENPGKDIGIMNLANNLPSTIVPAIAPVLLAIGATATSPQNFTALFIAGAVAALAGALCIVPIKSVR